MSDGSDIQWNLSDAMDRAVERARRSSRRQRVRYREILRESSIKWWVVSEVDA